MNARTPAEIYRFDVDASSDTAAANVLRFVGQGKRVLEIGAGPGSIARPLAEINGCRVSALELDEASVEILQGFCEAVVRHAEGILARLAEENEMVMSIDAQGKLQFIDPRPASGAPSPKTDADSSFFVLSGKRDILRLRAAVTASDQVGRVQARGWDVTTKKELTATAPATANPGIRIGTTPGAAASAFGQATLVDTGTPYDKQSEVKNAADARVLKSPQQRQRMAQAIADGIAAQLNP